LYMFCFFFQAEDGIRDDLVTGVQTCALPISLRHLKGLPFVDGDRVVLMGWSHGGWTTLEAIASRRYRSSPDQFRAAIAFYPWCRSEERRVGKECRCRWARERRKENTYVDTAM